MVRCELSLFLRKFVLLFKIFRKTATLCCVCWMYAFGPTAIGAVLHGFKKTHRQSHYIVMSLHSEPAQVWHGALKKIAIFNAGRLVRLSMSLYVFTVQ